MKARYSRDSISPEMYEVLKAEAVRIAEEEYDKLQKKQLMWMWAITLMALHKILGFGKKRLMKVFNGMIADYDEQVERYGLNQLPTAKSKKVREKQKAGMMTYGELCVIKLQDMGLDVKSMFEAAEGENDVA